MPQTSAPPREGRDREHEKWLEEIEEATGRRLAQDVLADRLREPGVLAQLGDVVRIAEEPRIEHEVRLEGHAELEAEADELDRHRARLQAAPASAEALAQLAQRKIGGIQHGTVPGPD